MFTMLPRFQSIFLALTMALLIVLGTLGIYSAEASTFRTTMRDADTYDHLTTIDAYAPGASDTYMVTSPGVPY
jgi:hypothetical protein